MVGNRDQDLQHFIDTTEQAIRARSADCPDAMAMVDKIFTTLRKAGEPDGDTVASRRPACRHLDQALDIARRAEAPLPALADAFAAIEPKFAWQRRSKVDHEAADFGDNHANAVIVGVGGLEDCEQVRIGVSLVAPHIDYPRHRHPPEEVYMVMSPGKWMQNDETPQPRRSGDLIHNTPNAWHAMHSGDVPLLTLWCLWTGD